MRDEKLHAKRRAQLQMAYSGKEDVNIESTINVHLQSLTSLIRRKYVSSSTEFRPMDLSCVVSPTMFRIAFNRKMFKRLSLKSIRDFVHFSYFRFWTDYKTHDLHRHNISASIRL
jgi:hypothetical protein